MDKPLSQFLVNVVKNGSITLEEAATYNQLATPHLQFEAVMARKRARQISPCSEIVLQAQPKTSFMENTRWVEIAVLGLAIPLIHSFWVRPPEIKKSASEFAAAQPAVFVAAPASLPLPKKQSFHPRNESEALSHFMNEPVQQAAAMHAYQLTMRNAPSPLSEQAAVDAENAALDALPNTSRR